MENKLHCEPKQYMQDLMNKGCTYFNKSKIVVHVIVVPWASAGAWVLYPEGSFMYS